MTPTPASLLTGVRTAWSQELLAQMEAELGEDGEGMAEGEDGEDRLWRCNSEHLTDRVNYVEELSSVK